MNTNSVTQKIYLYSRVAISFIVYNFAEATTFIFLTNDNIVINYVMKAVQKILSTINAGKIRAVYVLNFITKPIQSINGKTFRITYNISEIKKAVLNLSSNVYITSFLSDILKPDFSLNTVKIGLLFVPIIAQFIPLSIYDPQTLGALDTKTLGEMDFSST